MRNEQIDGGSRNDVEGAGYRTAFQIVMLRGLYGHLKGFYDSALLTK